MNKRISWVIILLACFWSVRILAQPSQDINGKSVVKKAKRLPVLKMNINSSVVELMGVETSKFLANADQLQLYTIDYFCDTVARGITQTHIVGYKILSKADKLPVAILPALKNIMLSSASYFWDDLTKSCVFTPYIAAVFGNTKSKDQFVALYCFSCDEWEFHFKGKVIKEDSDLARRQLLYQFKAAFKDNKSIESLN